MKADNCADVTDGRGMGCANGLTESDRQDGTYGFVIPAGAMIGLGVGFLAGHPGSGVLIGVGLGLLASELIALVTRRMTGEGLRGESANPMVLLIGAFLIFIGTGLVLAPAVLWPYAIPGFMILLGILFLVRGFARIP